MSELAKAITPKTDAAPAESAKAKAKYPILDKTPSEWKEYELKSELPGKFEWRGVTYVTSELTEIQLAKLADDNGFGHIVRKK